MTKPELESAVSLLTKDKLDHFQCTCHEVALESRMCRFLKHLTNSDTPEITKPKWTFETFSLLKKLRFGPFSMSVWRGVAPETRIIDFCKDLDELR